MSDTPETREALERWRQGKINIGDELARLETERNAAIAARKASAADWRSQVENANQRTIRSEQRAASLGKALDEARRDRDEARALVIHLAEAIVSTLEDNRHLADGENCTLARLKAAVPHWK